MEQELAEIESIFSYHFGRTPSNSQRSEVEIDDEPLDIIETDVANLIDGRARHYVENHGSESEASGDETNHSDKDETNEDQDKIQRFLDNGCGCKLGCHTMHSLNDIYDHVLSVRDMTKDEKEIYLMGKLNDSAGEDTTKRGKKRQRMRYTFRFRGRTVCKSTFFMCFDIGKTALQNILSHLSQHGIAPRSHGNSGKRKPHSLKFEDVQRAVRFISNHADIRGIPQPAAPRGRDNIPPIYLSADTTKCKLHTDYLAACTNVNPPVRTMKMSAFKTVWLSCLPHIKIASPRDDVCAACEKLRKTVADAVDEEIKLTASTELRNHILLAQQEREVYNMCIRSSIETRELPECEKYSHYTFDFSQCVSLPHFYRQMGPLYFLSLRKVQLFGFRVDGDPTQLNFLVDEGETMGGEAGDTHGPNSVISMVDWALETRGGGVTSCAIHADNCPGQNKNRYLLGYFAWRVMTGQHTRIEYMMQIPGHARCLIDGGFAHIKKLYRRTDCETLGQLESLVNKSSSTNVAVRYPQWQWRNWKGFLVQHFKPLTGIRKYQYFKFSSEEPGVVTVKETHESEEHQICLLRDPTYRFQDAIRPPIVPSQGLSMERQRYLYQSVRPYVRPAFQDELCPLPGNQ